MTIIQPVLFQNRTTVVTNSRQKIWQALVYLEPGYLCHFGVLLRFQVAFMAVSLTGTNRSTRLGLVTVDLPLPPLVPRYYINHSILSRPEPVLSGNPVMPPLWSASPVHDISPTRLRCDCVPDGHSNACCSSERAFHG